MPSSHFGLIFVHFFFVPQHATAICANATVEDISVHWGTILEGADREPWIHASSQKVDKKQGEATKKQTMKQTNTWKRPSSNNKFYHFFVKNIEIQPPDLWSFKVRGAWSSCSVSIRVSVDLRTTWAWRRALQHGRRSTFGFWHNDLWIAFEMYHLVNHI